MYMVCEKLAVVPHRCDPAVVSALQQLLILAERGEIVGLAYVALQPGYDYRGDAVGIALQHPVMALGLTKALEAQVLTLLK